MNSVQGWSVGLVIALGAWACAAQEASTQIEQLPSAPQAQTHMMLSAKNAPEPVLPGALPSYSLAVNNAPPLPAKRYRTIDAKFLLVNALHLGSAILDVELTQSCIASHHCQEGNPIMPSSQAGQLAVSFAFVAYGSGVGYWLKKHKSRTWWLPATAGIAGHIAGAATGFAHQ
jgi:hypothetical protein